MIDLLFFSVSVFIPFYSIQISDFIPFFDKIVSVFIPFLFDKH